MCTNNSKDFDYLKNWKDLDKLREEVELQKSKVESLKSEQKWMNNSFTTSDFCGQAKLGRSDSGIDRQSLSMECLREDSNTNFLNQNCSTSSIKKVIEITSLIRMIEHQVNIPRDRTDFHSMKTYNSTCSMPRCIHEFPELNYSNNSWIHNQLTSSSIEQEKLSKQLSYYNNQIFKIENVRMPVLLNGITTEQLKKRVDEYYKLKSCLTDLATSSTCNGTAMISVVKQLEPIAQSVEQYFKVSYELKNIHSQISVIIQRKHIIQNKRNQLLKILQMSNSQKAQTEILSQSTSLNESSANIQNSQNNSNHIPRNEISEHFADDNSYLTIEPKQSDEELRNVLKGVYWPPFNGDGIAEENPPEYNESFIIPEKDNNKTHSRLLCHQYVNEDVIRSNEYKTIPQTVDLIISSFPFESIAIIQVKGFKLHNSLQNNEQYRARLLQLNGEGSDWNSVWSSEDGKQIFISPYIILPIQWIFSSTATLSLLLELQFLNKGIGTTSNCFIFNIKPLRVIQKISVPLHTVQTWNSNSDSKFDIKSMFENKNTNGSLKIPQQMTNDDRTLFSNVQSGMLLLANPILNHCDPPVQYSSIRRSQTYSHDHQYCGNYECCSSIDFVSEPMVRMNPKYFLKPFNLIRPLRNHSAKAMFKEESLFANTGSSFKRQSIFRQPIRVKRNASDQDIDCDHLSQFSDHESNDILLQELWRVVCDLYLAVNSTCSLDEKLFEFAYFKTKCPSNLLKLYNYFVKTIFDPDQK